MGTVSAWCARRVRVRAWDVFLLGTAMTGLQRLRSSKVLKGTAIAAIMGYGALIGLVIFGKLSFEHAAMVAVMSLASWFFLFWWLPVIESTNAKLGANAGPASLGVVLETIAIGCVVLVHVLMALIVVYVARSPPSLWFTAWRPSSITRQW